MSAATTISRITGLLRTVAQTAALGTGALAGAYTLSNTLPNQIYELFMGGLLSSILIPVLVERLTAHGEEDARELVGALLTLIVPLLTVVALLGIVFAAPLIDLVSNWQGSEELSPEDAGQRFSLAVLLFRVFALQILFYGLGALGIGILNSHRRFFLPMFAPVLNNLVVIASFGGYVLLTALGQRETAVYFLAVGTTFGVAVMSLILLPAVWRLGYRPRLRLGHPALGPAARLAGPMLVFVASSVGVQLIAYRLASGFGGTAEIQYAFIIFQLPYGVFAVAIATALTPELSEHHTRGDTAGYRYTLSFGLRNLAFIMVPALVGLAALSVPIIGALYERGAFGYEDTLSVAPILTAYAAGLLGYAAYFVLVRSFYSRQNTRTPAALNVGLLALYVVLALVLTSALGLIGVALAFSAAYTVLALALLAAMRREIKRIEGRRLLGSLARILAAGAIMYAVARAGLAIMGSGSSFVGYAAVLILIGGASLAAYLGSAYLLRVEELRSAMTLLRRRSAPEGEDLGS